MQIEDGKVVTMDYVLKNSNGDVLDSSQQGEFTYLHGAQNIIPGLESALQGKNPGDSVNVVLEPKDAYGDRNENLVQTVSRSMFQTEGEINEGMQFNAQSPEGQSLIITVTNVNGDDITIDANHALAGEQLEFDVNVVDVRDASEEEKEHGHAHGPGGHQHG